MINLVENVDVKIGNSQAVIWLGNNLIYNGEDVPQVIDNGLILELNLNGNILDSSGKNIPIRTFPEGKVLTFSTGRKANTVAANFIGDLGLSSRNQNLDRVNVNSNTDKFSVSMWIKTVQTTGAGIIGLSPNFFKSNGLGLLLNSNSHKLLLADNTYVLTDQFLNIGGIISENFSTWKHIVFTVDRSLNASLQSKIYINKVQKFALINQLGYNADNNLNFIESSIDIGVGRTDVTHGSVDFFNGLIQDVKVYNKALTQTEVNELYLL